MDVRQATTRRHDAFRPPHAEPVKHVPGFFGFIYRVVRNPLSALPEAVYHEPFLANDAVGGKVVWVTHPALVDQILQGTRDAFPKSGLDFELLRPLLGKGLLTTDGDDWRWQRQTVAPLFRHQEVLRYVPHMTLAADDLLARWRRAPSGTIQPVDHDMAEATFQVIASTMLHGGDDNACPSIAKLAEDFLAPISWPVAYGLAGLPVWTPFPGRARMRRAIKGLRACVGDIIATRRAAISVGEGEVDGDDEGRGAGAGAQRDAIKGTGGDPAGTGQNDLLARALEARNPETGARMTDRQILDTLLTFLLAGHETTARALTWTLYLLARAPKWQDIVQAEIEAVAGDGPITAAHFDALPLATKVLKESMRLYPPVPVLTRVVKRDIAIGELRMKAATLVVIPIYAVHRHEGLWQDPNSFDPERFDPERERRYPRTQFMPFGAGPRFCIGSSFAMIEAIAILATLLRGARFEVAAGHHPVPIARVTLRPKGGMPLKVTLR